MALAASIPGGVLVLLAIGTAELVRSKIRRKRGGAAKATPLSGTYADELTAMFLGTKRAELDHRDSWSMMRDEQEQGAPPWLGVDLARGTVTLPRDVGLGRESRPG
jgi:hypothetical protein